MHIRIANHQDSPQIRKILEKYLIDINDPNTPKDKAQSGFLVRNISVKQIEDLILDDKNNLTLVAQNNDKIVGYLMSSGFPSLPEDLKVGVLPTLEEIKISDLEKIIYYRQIAVDPDFSALKDNNIGKSLIAEFIKQSKIRGYKNILCRIVFEPIYNSRSVAFHQKNGFDLIGKITEKGMTAGIYLKSLTND